MRRPTKHTVAYVLRDDANHSGPKSAFPRHCLGINKLAIDPKNEILYSAGRDGLVLGWRVNTRFSAYSQIKGFDTGRVKSIRTAALKIKEACVRILFARTKTESRVQFSSQHHSDWINDLMVSPDGESVFTASSDRTVKLWRPHSDPRGEKVELLGYHTDFVKCLAYAPVTNWLCSGGLDGKIHLWDVGGQGASPAQRLVATLTDTSAPHASYYAVAVGPAGRLVAGGSPDGLIRLWDPRADPASGTFSHFTGHSDSVRSILLSQDNRWMLSASSDSTIKLWSLASQRCVKTYTMHSDPVWCLFSPDPDLRHFYAGGRSGLVTKTLVGDLIDSHQRTLSHESEESLQQDDYDDETDTVVVCREKAGITSLTATHDHLHMWTAMPCAHIHRWEDVPPSSLPNPALASSPDDEEPAQPVRSAPAEVLLGTAGLTKCHILADRRHVLSLDSDGQVAMWDIVRGCLVERLGKVSLEETFQARNPAVVIPNWCSVDTKVGVLSVRLDQTSCFDAEVYQDELELNDAVPDELVNLGRWVLRSLFAPIIRIHAKSPAFIPSPIKEILPAKALAPPQPAATLPPPAIPFHLTSPTSPTLGRAPPEESIPPPQPALSAPTSGFMGRLRQFSVRKLNRSPDQTKPVMALSSRAPISPTHPSPSAQLPPSPESVSSASSSEQEDPHPNDTPFATPPTSNGRNMPSPITLAAPTIPELDLPHHIILQLSEESGDVSTCIDIYSGTLGSQADESNHIIPLLPAWVTDCIFKNIIPFKEVVKIGFQFKPHESSGLSLPALNSRLLAIRTLRCKKLATFLWEKLNYTPDMLLALLNRRQANANAATGQRGNPDLGSESTPSATLPPFVPEHWIVLMCNDQPLNCNMTLATVKQFMWKASGDIVITFDIQPNPKPN